MKTLCKIFTVVSELDFSIFGEILLCVVAFLGFMKLISILISLNDAGLNLELFPFVDLFLIREILGRYSNFLIACWTGSEIFSFSLFIIEEFSVVAQVETAFLKNSFDFSVISLSYWKTSSSASLILTP